MRHLWLGLGLALALATSASSQNFTMPPPAGVVVIGCAANTNPPTVTVAQPYFIQCDANGNIRVVTTPSSTTGTTTQTKVTISVTNTYQQALASSTTRKGCTLQYIAVAGTKGFVFFGTAPADTTTSFQLTNGQTISCGSPGVVLSDAVQVTGTGTDIFVVSNQ